MSWMVKEKKLTTRTLPKQKHRAKLRKVNSCFLRHWIDLELQDEEFKVLASKLHSDEHKNPIDFSARTLVRIFSNGSFKEGGRFYRGWWQNVPVITKTRYDRYEKNMSMTSHN